PDDPGFLPYRPALSRLVPEWRSGRPDGADDSLVVLAEAALRLLLELGRPGGCLLVLEDLHEADADTLAVLDYLIDNGAHEPVLVVGTVRASPSAALTLARAAARRRSASVLQLGRLTEDDVRQLAADCLEMTPDQVPGPVLERLLATTDGVPLYVEELLAGMVTDGALAGAAGAWVLAGPLPAQPPPTLAATIAARADRLAPATRDLLRAAALLGAQFSAVTAGTTIGVEGAALVSCLREAIDAQLIVATGDPVQYAFRHVLTAESLRAQLLPMERAELSRRAASAVEAGPPAGGGWELLAGELWLAAGEHQLAAQRLAVAGRRAATQGAVITGITILERALGTADPGELRADLAESLIDAYAIAGRIEDAYALGERCQADAAPGRGAAIRLQLARVAHAAGHWQRGLDDVAEARELDPDPAISAQLDVVAARLTFGNPTVERQAATQVLALRALAAAEANGQPDVACGALEVLGRCARLRDLAEADGLYERGLAIADANNLVSQRITLLYQRGANDGIRRADPGRLTLALTVAQHAGAVVTALNVELELAVVQVCRGEYAAAAAATRRCEDTAVRLRLTHTRLIAVGVLVIAAAHQGQPSDVTELLTRFRDLGGEHDDISSAVHGFGMAIGYLLREDITRATASLAAAAALEARRPASYVSYIHGPHLLLSVLGGSAGEAGCAAMARSGHVQAGWNHQFLVLAEAILAGRSGRPGDASQGVAHFFELSAPYPLARHLGLRLVAADAVEHQWGDPGRWLRTAEAYFHEHGPDVARACRKLLRQLGLPAPQHRQGSDAIPGGLRELGVSVREYEVLRLVGDQLGNVEIGRRLFLSPRTVEKHVASLLAKTGQGDRAALTGFARAL
ncbi:MAG: hypothetical protein QOD41_1434, partial [Cryptosporangiaceae bacterium]|nr:hypothetical protein [Cryptosporangiaceae bacterium]